jgi:hypothetical protein
MSLLLAGSFRVFAFYTDGKPEQPRAGMRQRRGKRRLAMPVNASDHEIKALIGLDLQLVE